MAKWCSSQGAQRKNVKLQENYDVPHGVTKLTKHETPDLLEGARRDPLRHVDKRGPTPEKALVQMCLEARFKELKKDNAS